MTEFIGSPIAITAQKNIRDRQSKTATMPKWANGGRIMVFLEPETRDWDDIKQIAGQDCMAGFPLVAEDKMRRAIGHNLGSDWQTPSWLALIGGEDQVLSACEKVIAAVDMPSDLNAVYHECPSDEETSQIQVLNSETGVSPYPAYFMRSEAVPVLTVAIKDTKNSVVATASATMRYHPDCEFGKYVFAGMVSVTQAYRGKGLGKLVNALVLQESHQRYNWTHASENVSADNPVSLAMIKSCGLDLSAGLATVAAIKTGEAFTR